MLPPRHPAPERHVGHLDAISAGAHDVPEPESVPSQRDADTDECTTHSRRILVRPFRSSTQPRSPRVRVIQDRNDSALAASDP